MQKTDGKIIFRDASKQLNDFSGMKFGSITPTDLDGLIEYQNSAYVLIETKRVGALFTGGQKLALERLCDDLNNIYKPTILILAEHNIENPKEDIDVAKTKVRYFRFKGIDYPGKGATTREITERFLNKKLIIPDFKYIQGKML